MERQFTNSIIITFFAWWYLEFPKQIFKIFKLATTNLIQSFSVPEILKTFFSTWKRTYNSVAGKSLNDKINALVDNLISRGIGITIRTFLIIVFVFFVIIYSLLLLLILTAWLVGPVLPFVVLIIGIFKING